MSNREPPITEAETLMKQRRIPEAIVLLEERVNTRPDDPRALLTLGVCHLLNGSERAFLTIYDRARLLLERLRDIPDDLARLWQKYRNLVVKVTASALIVGTAGLAGCTKSGSEQKAGEIPPAVQKTKPSDAAAQPASQISDAAPAPADAAEPANVPPPPPPDAAAKPKPTTKPRPPASMHKYSGGVYLKPDLPKQPPASSEPDKKPEPDVKPGSMHRYSGGVYLEPREPKKPHSVLEDQQDDTPPSRQS